MKKFRKKVLVVLIVKERYWCCRSGADTGTAVGLVEGLPGGGVMHNARA